MIRHSLVEDACGPGSKPSRAMRIALAQMMVTADKVANLEKIASFAGQAAERQAGMLVFPEGAMVHLGDPAEPLAPVAESLDGSFVQHLTSLARDHRMVMVAGMVERIPGEAVVYNTVVVVDRTGSLVGAYRKIHLFDAFGHAESARIRPGTGETLTFTLDNLTYGVMTCYDVRFPELARHLTVRGAQVIVLPAGWVHGVMKEEHWEIMVRARAIENTTYMAAADQVGNIYSGRSMFVDPLGVVQSAAGEEETLIIGEASPERVARVRAKLPSIEHVRPDVYAGWHRTR